MRERPEREMREGSSKGEEVEFREIGKTDQRESAEREEWGQSEG